MTAAPARLECGGVLDEDALPKIRPRVLAREVVLSAVRERMLAERIAPGRHISEVAVAAQMGVSHALCCEAIRHMEQEELVKYLPTRRGPKPPDGPACGPSHRSLAIKPVEPIGTMILVGERQEEEP